MDQFVGVVRDPRAVTRINEQSRGVDQPAPGLTQSLDDERRHVKQRTVFLRLAGEQLPAGHADLHAGFNPGLREKITKTAVIRHRLIRQ